MYLLLAFFPEGKHWFEYLDLIWNAAEVADRIGADVLPALMLRVRKQGRLRRDPAYRCKRSSLTT